MLWKTLPGLTNIKINKILFFFLYWYAQKAPSQILHNGDLLFQNIDCGEFCEAINAVTPDYQGKHYSHVGMYITLNQQPFVVEAISKGVCLTPLDTFLYRTQFNNIVVGRLKKSFNRPTYNDIKAYLNAPYDSVFDINNQAYYCSELIYFLYQKANNKPVFTLQPMTFKKPLSNNFFPIWVSYFNKMNVPIPEGKPGINPGSMLNTTNVFDTLFLYPVK
jgi:hypothetical protein